jgi:AmmeMemoRadiSam system protein B
MINLKYFTSLTLLSIFLWGIVNAQALRPVRDSIGYCLNASQMDSFIKYLSNNQNEPSDNPANNLVAGISPHDDFLYAGRVYYPLFRLIRTKEVVIFGVTHGTVRTEIGDPKNILILDDYFHWHGPYKYVSVSPLREFIKQKLNKEYFIVNDKAQSLEHSIEGLLPFLQHYNREINITPIMVTAMPSDKMRELSNKLAKIICEYIRNNNLTLGKDIFFLMSSDANHYGKDFNNFPYGLDEKAHTTGTGNDKRIAGKCLEGKITAAKIESLINELFPDSTSGAAKPLWCGRYSIPFGLMTTSMVINQLTGKEIYGKLLKYSDTWTEKVLSVKNTSLGITAPFSLSHWVGFLSVGFYIEN